MRNERKRRALIDRIIRVDRAGELAANWIYSGQHAVLGSDVKMGPLIQVCLSNRLHLNNLLKRRQKMWEQEKKHLTVMDQLQLQHRVRPTVLSDVAKGVSFALGAATALMGSEAAMACTEAVETVIGEHYDE